jgi:GxxExxY protein
VKGEDILARRTQSHQGNGAPDVEALASVAIDIGYHMHRDLGPGLLESVYEAIMVEEFEARGMAVERQVLVPNMYRGRTIENALRADLLIERNLLIDLKSTEQHAPVHAKQVLTYLKLMQLPLGWLINFVAPTFKQGVRRLANDYYRP